MSIKRIFGETRRHVRRWNIWRKRSLDHPVTKLMVLLGIVSAPTMAFIFLPEEWTRFRIGLMKG